MKYIIPKYSGFCSGVSIAVRSAYRNIGERSYMYGEVVHNPTVIRELESKGWKLIASVEEIGDPQGAKVLIRAHGVSKAVMDRMEERGLEVIDSTCVNVRKIHRLVREASERGLDGIVVGTPHHPEVEGIVGWISTKSVVIHSVEDAESKLKDADFSGKGVFIVSQTTFHPKKYREIYEYCASVIPGLEFYDTTCNVTANRQAEVSRLTKTADAFIVVGGKTSSNVNNLYKIICESCTNAQFIETVSELDTEKIRGAEKLVIVGGASTPESCISDVIGRIGRFCTENGIAFEREEP